jgi:hypothetical protein
MEKGDGLRPLKTGFLEMPITVNFLDFFSVYIV